MDPDRETEAMINVACGLDLPTAISAASDDETPPKKPGCLVALILIGGVLWAIAQL